MKTLSHLLFAGILLVGFSACNGQPADDQYADDPAFTEAPATEGTETEARMEDGEQVIEITATAEGFQPARFSVQEGVPTRLVITRTTDSACMEQFQIPEMGVERTDLPRDEPIEVRFTPDQAGEFTFGCGMDMMVSGTVVVRT
jgi:membrane fusion protein, copper/silver efflux system